MEPSFRRSEGSLGESEWPISRYPCAIFFDSAAAKILVLLELRSRDMTSNLQNIEEERLICKILRNKELAEDIRGRNAEAKLLPGF
jgi:hypothetical protein